MQPMLSITLIACVLVAVTVAMHAAGLAVLLRNLRRFHAVTPMRFWPVILLLIHMTLWLILIHMAEISVWGLFYLWGGYLPDAEAAFYYAGVTYTTIGYGDLVLAKPWRLIGAIEGLTGILMCGLSTGFFFAVLSRVYQSQNVKTTRNQSTERTQT